MSTHKSVQRRGHRARRILLWGTVLVGLWRTFHFWPILPERVASHFGAGGQVDGWTSKQGLLLGLVVLLVGMALLAELVDLLLRKAPISIINMPNREFWLAPQRRDATRLDMQEKLLELMIATNIFLLIAFELTYQANLHPEPRLPDSFLVWLVVYLVVCAVLTLRMIRPYLSVPPDADHSSAISPS